MPKALLRSYPRRQSRIEEGRALETLYRIALHWQEGKRIVAPDPGTRDHVHVVVGLVLFLAVRPLLHRTRFPSAYAIGLVAALQGLNELFDAAANGMRVGWPEALSDTALTLAPALLAALLVQAWIRTRRHGAPD